MLEFFKQQEKQQLEGLKILQQSIEHQEERFVKLLECATKKESNSGNFNTLIQDSVINFIGKFICKLEEMTFEAYF